MTDFAEISNGYGGFYSGAVASAELEFRNKKPNPNKLISYGFCKTGNGFEYKTILKGIGFEMYVTISGDGEISTCCIDSETGEEYIVHLIEGSVGSFVGLVREGYNAVLSDISEKCFDADVYKTVQASAVLKTVCEKYHIEPDFPFDGDTIVLRRKDNNKWFAVFLKIPASKIGLAGDEETEILNIKLEPSEVEALVDKKRYFPVYHMNKKHWITIPFGGYVETDKILELIDKSYKLTGRR